MSTEATVRSTEAERAILLQLLASTVVGQNLVCSPALIRHGLTVLATGARGSTAEALGGFLGVDGEDAREALAFDLSVLDSINVVDDSWFVEFDEQGERQVRHAENVALDMVTFAAALWSRVPVYADWRARIPSVGIGQLGVDDPDRWVSEATHGLIDRLVVEVGPDVLAVLALAAHLRAKWRRPFDADETVDRPFAGVEGGVPFMHKRSKAFRYWRNDAAEVVQIPYNSSFDDRWGEVVLLVGMADDDPSRAAASVLDLVEKELPRSDVEVDLYLPRFRIDRRGEAAVDLKEPLEACGLGELFEDDCDLGALSPEPLKLSEALAQALIEVDEEGTTAVATVEFAMVAGGAAPAEPELVTVEFDRPFVYLVRLGRRGPIFFGGWVSDPSSS